jgi:hypothetical protein
VSCKQQGDKVFLVALYDVTSSMAAIEFDCVVMLEATHASPLVKPG